jgi:polyribonucleotide nucleotidyltransferase
VPEITVSGEVGGKTLTFSTGKLAGQADGAVVAKLGGTEMLVTATANKTMREGIDFFPLTVDFEERMYAVGRIPGSFFRREGRPSEEAILTCRLIDRPLRPSFPDDYRCETHIVVTSLSVDGENPFDVVALNGASAALAVSPIPFNGPVGGVRMALKKGEWIPFPTESDLDESVFELVVAGRRNPQGEIDIMMVEAGATPEGLRLVAAGDPPSDEAAVSTALEEAKPYIAQVIDLIAELASKVEKPHVEWPRAIDYTPELYDRVAELARPKLTDVIRIPGKQERNDAADRAFEEVLAEMGVADDDAETKVQAARAFKSILKEMMRNRVIDEGVRLDGRGPRDIRPLSAEVSVIERAHGSALFQRGETQVLTITTLGMLKMEQMLDTLAPEESKRYMHHYNFPPFSTGEAGFMRGPKRREIGHGALAEKAVLPVVPDSDTFPYALRLVSEVLSSNGSTSMASVCASSLSLMDAGVPISEPVAGIAMGLIHRDGNFVTLTDILGAEDALGDMDFKVAGTANVITALQLDTKIEGLPSEVLSAALDQAKEARLKILEVMREAIPAPREEMKPYAPRIESIEIPKDKIGEVIGPKGAVVRELEAETGATIEIDEADGKGIVRIASNDGEILKKTKERILQIAYPPQPEIGAEYEGEVVNITKFGAFVNILPGTDGLLHISKLDGSKRVERVEDYLELGDKVKVRVGGIDRGKLSLDLVEALPGATLPEPGGNGGKGGSESGRAEGRDRGDRRGGGGGRGRDRDRRGGDRDRNRDRNRDTNQSGGGGGDGGNRERRRVARSFEETFEDTR